MIYKVTHFADDNSPYNIANKIDDLIKSLEETSTTLFQWFDSTLLKSKSDKCHVLISSNEKVIVQVGEYEIEISKCEKLLDAKLEWKLNFDDHLSDVCKKLLVN